MEMVTVVCAITRAQLASVTLSQTHRRLHKHFHAWLISFASMLCPITASLSVRLDPLSDWMRNQYSSSFGNCNGHACLWWNFSLSQLTSTKDYYNMTRFPQQGLISDLSVRLPVLRLGFVQP